MSTSGQIPIRQSLITLVRIVLGIVFIFASIEKIADPGAFASSIGTYRIIPESPALLVATVLPWIELLCGLGILFGVCARGSALLILIMLVMFAGLVISAMLRGLDISCGCFTQGPSAGRIGWSKMGEDLVLIFMTCLVLSQSRLSFSLERFIRTRWQRMQHKG